MPTRLVSLFLVIVAVLIFCVCIPAAMSGCGNVLLSGESLTAAQQSVMDGYQAVQRANADPATPEWEKAYLTENFKQWRFYVRSARKDLTWGPTLASESTTQPAK